jgi:L-ascorbate metabolism protein UlaG (beta-lactamase superfamily)
MKATTYPVLLLLISSFVLADSRGHNAGDGDMQRTAALDSLTMIGHASAKITTSDGKVIYLDPFQPGDYSDSADIVLISHQHSDHNRLNMVRQKPTCTVITNAQAHPDSTYKSFTIGNITVTAVPAYNANHQRTQCVGYVVEFNGIKLYHAGDTGNIIEMADLAARNLTYALLPIDGVFTMSPEVATQAAAAIDAAYNIPMHTMTTPDTFSTANVARFTPPNKIVVRNGESIALQSVTSVDNTPTRPVRFELRQNYPNPFNPTTTISYLIPKESHVQITLIDLLGREIATLVNARETAGEHSVVLDGSRFGSGVYFYRFRSGEFVETRKLVLLR